MLASLRVSRRRDRWLELRLDSALSLSEDGDLTVDVNALKALICPPDFSWSYMTSACCRTISPVYSGLWNSVQEDFENVARVLSELQVEPPSEEGEENDDDVSTTEFSGDESLPPVDVPPRRKRRRSSLTTQPYTIHGAGPSTPAIVVTPSPPQERETSCWVPIQDASFGSRLTVPTHVAFNDVFPPLAVPLASSRSGPYSLPVQRWEYVGGHWVAVLHELEEQTRRGMYSKSTACRRRSWRRPRVGRSKSAERRSVFSS